MVGDLDIGVFGLGGSSAAPFDKHIYTALRPEMSQEFRQGGGAECLSFRGFHFTWQEGGGQRSA